jgi:peptidoglycan hydrolase-like protein with peptidoglycan-binding domain
LPELDRRSRTTAVLALVAALLLLAAACGSDDGDDTSSDDSATTTSAADTTETTTAAEASDETKFVKDVQGQLQQVGCYEGAIDGEDGPETKAAIDAFQKAEGLAVDDEVGPETENALKAAVASGRHDVCSGSSTSASTSTTAGGGASTTSTTTGGGGASTSTTAGGGGGNVAPCTADAIQAGLASGETLHKWQCARDSSGQDYAGGTQSKSGSTDRTNFILWAKDGKWTAYTGSCDSLPALVKEYCG